MRIIILWYKYASEANKNACKTSKFTEDIFVNLINFGECAGYSFYIVLSRLHQK